MKAFASSFVLLLVAALLGGWWWWREQDASLPPGVQNVARLKVETIQGITLKSADSSDTTLKFQRADSGRWQISTSQNARAVPADNALVQQWLKRFSDLNSDAVYDDDAAKRARFGLDKPRARCEIVGAQTLKIEWGDRAPFAPPRIYARVQSEKENRIALLPLDLWQSSQRSFEAWRDRRVLGFDIEKVRSISMRAPQIHAEFAKNSSGWQIVKPLRENADAANIASLLNALQAARVVRWPKDSPANTSKPLAVVSIEGDGAQTLNVERRVNDNFLARRISAAGDENLLDNESFILSGEIFAALNKPLIAWRSKTVFDFAVNAVSGATITARGRSITFQHDGATWRQIAPAQSSENRGNAVWEVLLPARDLRAQSFAPSASWPDGAPALDVRIVENGVSRRLQIASQQGRVLARAWRDSAVAPQNTPIWVLSPDALQRFDVALNTLFTARPMPTLPGGKSGARR